MMKAELAALFLIARPQTIRRARDRAKLAEIALRSLLR
jgi:hypothetical protein